MYSASDRGLDVLIRKLERLAPLSYAERQAVEGLPLTVRILTARQDIVREGDRPSQCCLMLDGWAYRYKLLGGGGRQILSFHLPGDVPDLQSLHLPVTDHSLCTLTDATVGFLPHEEVHALTARFPRVAALLWRETLIEAGIFRAWMTGMGRRVAYARIAHLFCELYVKLEAVGLADDCRCPIPLTQIDLADALGLTSVHVNRVLQEMRAKRLITLRKRMLVIHDWDGLVAAAEFDPAYLHQGARPLAAAYTASSQPPFPAAVLSLSDAARGC